MLRALAQAMGTQPRGTLKELAELAGISKATLHRFCGTREHLVEMLLNHASEVLSQLIEASELDSPGPAHALRRLVSAHLEQRETIRFLMFVGMLVLRLDQRTVSWRGEDVDLPTSEYRVLEVLARYAGVTLSREELTQRVRGIAFDHDDRSIDVAISKLRRKFGDPAGNAKKIKTVWGRGYVLKPAEWTE